MSIIYKNYNPDILETIANLSNDEVFTPPKLANEILDLLPEEVWSDSTITFLDPAVKTGIFLREIASRLIDGLAEEIPDLQERVNHILTKQVFGIGITELTTLMARRTVYCSMTANGEFSICTEFDDEKGNIVFPNTEHTWNDKGRCEFCGANEDGYGGGGNKENYAYPFIHDNFEKEFGDMKFDVIIGNPPYQLNVGNEGGNSSKAKAIYHLFIDKAIELNPKYINMIIPSRWMTRTADGIPLKWVDDMIKDTRIKILHDYINSNSIFPSVGINGGVNYFLWDKDYDGLCDFYQHDEGKVKMINTPLDTKGTGVVIRDINSISILDKVLEVENKYIFKDDKNFSSMVSPKDYFTSSNKLTTNWKDYSLVRTIDKSVKYYMSGNTNKSDVGWISKEDIGRNIKAVDLNKVYIPATRNPDKRILSNPRYGESNSVCSQTYVVIGYKHNLTKKECLNIISYIETKFFRFMVRIKKNTTSASRGVYQFVPLQDWSKPWTDEELYKKYKLTQEEIDYIEETIEPMTTLDD